MSADDVRDGLARVAHDIECGVPGCQADNLHYEWADAALAYLAEQRPDTRATRADAEAVYLDPTRNHEPVAMFLAGADWQRGRMGGGQRVDVEAVASAEAERRYPNDQSAPYRIRPAMLSAFVEGAQWLAALPPTAPALPCDQCGAPSTHVSTPGGFRFCGEHGPTAPEVVTTAAELDALPVLSVIVDASGHSWYRPDEEWVCLDGDRFSSGLIWEEAEHPIMLHRPSPYRPTTTEDQP